MNNYYNSVQLSEDHVHSGVRTWVTPSLVRGAPKDMLKMAKVKMDNQQVIFNQKGNTGILLYKDKKVVSVITNLHNSNTTTKIGHWKICAEGWTQYAHQHIQKPNAIEDYNKNMGGVDHFVQMIYYYSPHTNIDQNNCFYFLQMAIYNFFALYKK